ncbi:MAG: phosphatidate cytidylyltransferase [Clostridia bacterium]|nr:phosphatidate cytidylyltransferase [Clostridia bacterium]MBQ1435334.1 phosphatidate cytidylyltransferase [Clostridia bacterium]MBQ4248685.1 phosphatidate cytidylyltransferase [Clostridia bacterium]
MGKRLISAAVGLVILLVVLFSNNLYLMEGCMVVISLVAMYELYKTIGILKYKPLAVVGAICAVVIMFFQFAGISSFFGLILLTVTALFLIVIIGGGEKIKFEHIAMVFMIAIFVPVFFSQVVKVRMLEHGEYLIYLVFFAAFITDSCAFFVGRICGRHKFAPRVSPKKTIEGAIGGLAGGILSFVIFGLVMERVFGFTANYLLLALFGALGAVIAEIGDLAASVIKRQYGVKDYGDIMPGHGGVLDRFDSVLFTAPLMSLLLHNFTVLT